MNPSKILLGPSSFSEVDPAPLNRLKQAGYQAVSNPYKRKFSKPELIDLLKPDVVGLIAGLETIDAEVLEKTHLRAVSRCGSGMSNVDVAAAQKLKIQVRSTPWAPVTSVAELVLAMMLNLLRDIPLMNQDLHAGKWAKRLGFQLEGKTVLIVGFGRIGQKMASLLKPFGVNLIVVDPLSSSQGKDFQVLSLAQALPKADIITVHISGEEPLLGSKEFELMKPGVFLLNAARGEVISESALIAALDQGKVAGAWIDTFVQEPYDGELRRFPQVILTPHVGSYTRECRVQMEMEAVENLIEALNVK